MPLTTEKGYKRVVRNLRIEEEMAQMESEIVASEGSKRANKFRTSDYTSRFGDSAAERDTKI